MIYVIYLKIKKKLIIWNYDRLQRYNNESIFILCKRYSANIQPILHECTNIVSALYQMQRTYDTAPISIL